MMQALYRNHMGNDLEVVNDAKISFAQASQALSWRTINISNCCETVRHRTAEVPELSARDINLIQFLARGCRSGEWEEALNSVAGLDGDALTKESAHELLTWAKRMPTHWTPAGQQVIKLKMKAPVPIRTQAFKSKIGMVENEESRRYIKSTPELFVPEFRSAPEGDIKQGSSGPHPENKEWKATYIQKCEDMIEFYENQVKAGIAPEQARFSLPQGVYVNWVWTGSLYAYAEFFNKRSDSHAQGEIQELAQAIAEVIEPLFPVSWRALTT